MTYRGKVHNGVVVFEGASPTEGTAVEVRPLTAGGAARRDQSTVDRIASEQGVTRVVPFDELLGGWPQGEEQDGFEQAVARWRAEEPRRGEF